MTIADGNSVYVGGLPYDANEDSIRKAFDLYGRVCAVKVRIYSQFFKILLSPIII